MRLTTWCYSCAAVLKKLGIEGRLQLSITLCVISLIVATTLGNSGGAPHIFFIYRTLLLCLAILTAIGSRHHEWRISRVFISLIVILFLLMLVSVLRISGSHFEAFY